MKQITHESLIDAAIQLIKIYSDDHKIAYSQLKNSQQFLVIGSGFDQILPIHRLIDGIGGGDMSARSRKSQELLRHKNDLLSAGFEEIRSNQKDQFDELWAQYLAACDHYNTNPSEGKEKRVFWRLSMSPTLPVALSPEQLADERNAHLEGAESQVTRNVRERNRAAREECVGIYTTDGVIKCLVCEFDFASTYGEIGRGFIHIHHLDPIAEANGRRMVDPDIDLVPLCPNCHAMIHRRKPQLSIDELVDQLKGME